MWIQAAIWTEGGTEKRTLEKQIRGKFVYLNISLSSSAIKLLFYEHYMTQSLNLSPLTTDNEQTQALLDFSNSDTPLKSKCERHNNSKVVGL